MLTKKILLSLLISFCYIGMISAHIDPNKPKCPATLNDEPTVQTSVDFRNNCNSAIAQIDQSINNVRARLTTGGDVWWNGSSGGYIVPKVGTGVPEVSSIFAGGVWLGGKDTQGTLKVAAQTFGRADGDFDFWPGPLVNSGVDVGTTDEETCKNWDRFFKVRADEINQFRALWRAAEDAGETLDVGSIPLNLRGWPANGNPYFLDIYNFELPDAEQGLAAFYDEDGDDKYNPLFGDFPIIQVAGCGEELGFSPQVPDEMIFWIYNDAGNIHAETTGDKMQMEIQVQAFSYATNDEINNMTFQRYKLINRAPESLVDTYFGMWVDADLGCHTDDYVGCNVEKSLAYTYNEDATDGEPGGCTCAGVNTYCNDVPILGVDYFRGPHDENGVELGMSSFVYYNNPSYGNPAAGTTDPETAQEYYNYLSGFWKDGSPFERGGDGYQEGTEPSPYVFSDAPDDGDGWSMCSENLPFADRRTVQASGPFRLDPGAVNELIVGVVWVPNQSYPCPSLTKLFEADEIAQKLFDECFDIPDGPDAPDIDFVELDQEVIAIFTNGKNVDLHNNFQEGYQGTGLRIPAGEEDDLYLFEGYQLYQLSSADVGLSPVNRTDPSKVRLVYQVDIENEISQIFNWESYEDGASIEHLTRVEKVEGENQGIRHTFKLTEDQFADGDRRLINHKKYYFVAIAYAYNNYEDYDPTTQSGQIEAYQEGRRNIGPLGDGKPYTVIPRPTTDRGLNTEYRSEVVITRLDGSGSGRNFLDISDKTRKEIEDGFLSGTKVDILTYKPGNGPIDVFVYNPLSVRDGDFLLNFTDELPDNNQLDEEVSWLLTDLEADNALPYLSEQTIERVNEQTIKDLGCSVAIGQVADVGTAPRKDPTNGAIGARVEYVDGAEAKPWLFGIANGYKPQAVPAGVNTYDFIPTGNGGKFEEFDPHQSLTRMGNGFFVPYWLCDWDMNQDDPFITPAWTFGHNDNVHSSTKLANLNNVDVVFTSNKDLWSRCVVIESTGRAISGSGFTTHGGQAHFDLRASPNVTKEAGADGLPVIDTEHSGEGMGWFPGYAIDVETGQRLNIFFGESSVYDGTSGLTGYTALPTGADMMFNPTSQFKLDLEGEFAPFVYTAGGQHFVYVTNEPYDECAFLQNQFSEHINFHKVAGLKQVTWAGLLMALPGQEMLSYDDGLIPADVIVKLRVNSPYEVKSGTDEFDGYPTYGFNLEGVEASDLDENGVSAALEQIAVVPNPYYGFSAYEGSTYENIVKITNLPSKCIVNIYALDGRFIRRYDRDELGIKPIGLGIDRNQIIPDIEWDLKNNKGIPVSSGVYLIHVAAEGLGERTIKWFGVNRQFDPTGL